MPLFSLEQLTVTNFRAVSGTVELHFDQKPGLYFIAGRNELHPRLGANDAGKSTLFCEALSWLLQARTSRSNRPGGDIVNWASGASRAGVAGLFRLGGIPYTLERYRNPTALLLNGQVVTQEEVNKLLPLSDAALRRTILIDQFGIMFLNLRPEEKSRIFSETLNLDLWVKAAERAGREQTEAERVIKRAEQDLQVTIATLAEVKDQREEAVARETAFEDERIATVASLKKELRTATEHQQETEAALNAARAKSAKFGDGSDIRELNDYKASERDLVRAIASSEALVESSTTELDRLRQRLGEYRNAKGVCPECLQPVTDEHIEEKAAIVRQQIRRLRSEITEETNTAQELPAQLEAIRLMITQIEEASKGLQAALGEVAVAAGNSIHADREKHRVTKALAEAVEKVNPFTDQCDKLDTRHGELVDKRRDQRLTLKQVEGSAEIYKYWQNGFREIRLEQIDTTLMELELVANRHGESLGLDNWEIQFATERETTSGTLSHKFTVFLYPPGQNDPVAWENYAGGVSQRWQLAVTSALAEILLARAGVDTDFEVFDEPTTHLSQEGIDDLLACLRERALEQNRRIFVIDHHALDRGVFDGVITVIKTMEGVRVE